MKKKTGYVIGRFSPVTLGHISLLRKALERVDVLLVIVGSADKKNTFRNPFCIETRMALLEEIFAKEIKEKRMLVRQLADLSSETEDIENGKWEEYLNKHVEQFLGCKPDIYFTGKEEARQNWFRKDTLVTTVEIERKDTFASATLVRNMLAKNEKEELAKHVDKVVIANIDKLREELFKVEEYRKIARGR